MELFDEIEEKLIETNGIKLHTVMIGEGPPLVLLHGFPDFWYGWKSVIPGLKSDYKLIIPDMRGYNLSDKPEGVENYKIELLREPGGTEIGEKVRAILLDVKFDRMSSFCELYLYLAARAQLIEEKIIPFLNEGKVVFCDRFIDATIAYQVCGSGVAPDFVDGFQKFVAAGLTPRLTILLDIDVETGLKRAASSHPQDRLEKKDVMYHQRVRRGYLELAKKILKQLQT